MAYLVNSKDKKLPQGCSQKWYRVVSNEWTCTADKITGLSHFSRDHVHTPINCEIARLPCGSVGSHRKS